MHLLISIAFTACGIYLASTNQMTSGLVLTSAGLFSLFLSVKIADLKESLESTKKENQKPSRRILKSPRQRTGNQGTSYSTKVNPNKASKPALSPEHEEDFRSGSEPPSWIKPEPVHVQPASSISTTQTPKIVTRTSKTIGGLAQETWKGEKTWSRDETTTLLRLYSDGGSLDSIAKTMRIDKKDVAYKLTRLNFADSGDLEDSSEAPNDGKTWSKEDSKKLDEMNSAGITLGGMAKILGRTKLAIGWRLADRGKLRIYPKSER